MPKHLDAKAELAAIRKAPPNKQYAVTIRLPNPIAARLLESSIERQQPLGTIAGEIVIDFISAHHEGIVLRLDPQLRERIDLIADSTSSDRESVAKSLIVEALPAALNRAIALAEASASATTKLKATK